MTIATRRARAPARDPPPRARVGAVGGARPRRAATRRRCWSSCRPTASRRWRGSATSTSCRRWRCSATWSTIRSGPRSCRSPRSAPSGRRSPGRSATTCRCGRSTCRCSSRWPALDDVRRRVDAADARPTRRSATRWPRWPRRRASPTPSGGGTTSSSTAATARRRSTRSPRRWPPCAAGAMPRTLREAQREAHMRQALRRAIADGHERIAVVCGAWHVPALDRAAAAGRRPMPRTLRGLPKVKVGLSWVPWTHRRLAVGQRLRRRRAQPGWYAHVFDHPGEPGVSRWFVGAARLLRDRGMSASPDDLIAATRAADGAGRAARPAAPRAGRGARRRRHGDGRHQRHDADPPRAGRRRRDRRGARRRAAGAAGPRPRRPAAHGAAEAGRPTRRRSSSTCARPTAGRRSLLLHRLRALGVPWGSVEEGRGTQRHVPRDVAAAVGARADHPGHRAVGPRHHRRRPRPRTGCSSAPRRSRRWPTWSPCSTSRCSPTCPTSCSRSSPASRRRPRTTPTSCS